MDTIHCCTACLKTLESFGEIAYETFLDICKSHVSRDPLIFSEESEIDYPNAIQIFRFLESKGYIITTEASFETYCVRPVFRQIAKHENNTHYEVCFCTKKKVLN